MTAQSSITKEQVDKGQAVYSRRILNIYDIAVLGISNRFIWQCPTPILLDWYNQHVSGQHLDIGVGTGYFLDHCRFPVTKPAIDLMDLNLNALRHTKKRLSRYQTCLHVHNILEPLTDTDAAGYQSIGLNYLLHCLPGNIHSKAVVFDHIQPLLSDGGKVFGSTILQEGVRRSSAAKGLMAIYNRKGIFSNTEDHLDGLQHELRSRFGKVEIRVTGCVARFVASGH